MVGREITHSEPTLSLLVSGNLLMPSYLSETGRQSNEPKNRLLQNSKNKSTSDSDKRKINCRNSLWRFVLIPKRRFPNYKNLKSSIFERPNLTLSVKLGPEVEFSPSVNIICALGHYRALPRGVRESFVRHFLVAPSLISRSLFL